MLSREEIKGFLDKQKDKTKEEVLSNFTIFALAYGINIDKIGKLIMDLRSYPEWIWGE